MAESRFHLSENRSYKKAIDYYLQSDLLIPDNAWNNRHLAQCYRKEGNYQQALEYYNKVEQVQPDNLNPDATNRTMPDGTGTIR